MLVLEVVEVGCAAVGTWRGGADSTLDAVLAVVLSATDDLYGLPENLGAQLTHKLSWNFPDKVKHVAIVLDLWTAVHRHDL